MLHVRNIQTFLSTALGAMCTRLPYSDPPLLASRPLLVAEGEADDAAGARVLLVLIGAALEKEIVF